MEILVADTTGNSIDFKRLQTWARQNYPSFSGLTVTDVSGVSDVYKKIGAYKFQDSLDAISFRINYTQYV